MRRLLTTFMLIICCVTVTGRPVAVYAAAQAMSDLAVPMHKAPPPPDGGDLAKVIDSISGTSILIPWTYYESQIVARWNSQLCIAPSQNLDDMRCTTLTEQDFITIDNIDYVKLGYHMALNDQTNIYSNRGLPHGMWFGFPCNGGWIKNFQYHAGAPGNQVEDIDNFPPTFPGYDVC